MSEFVARAFVSKECGDVIVGEVCVFEGIYNAVGLVTGGGDAKDRFF
jgi:hypothetical protein